MIERRAFDTEIAMFWAYHIENPCHPGIVPSYIDKATKAMEAFSNPFAKRFLELAIEKTENNPPLPSGLPNSLRKNL